MRRGGRPGISGARPGTPGGGAGAQRRRDAHTWVLGGEPWDHTERSGGLGPKDRLGTPALITESSIRTKDEMGKVIPDSASHRYLDAVSVGIEHDTLVVAIAGAPGFIEYQETVTSDSLSEFIDETLRTD